MSTEKPERPDAAGTSNRKVLETDRLILRRICLDDAAFILGLLNEPSWLKFIGDKGVRTLEDARQYILKGPVASYLRFGFGLYRAERKGDATPIGICGLLKRDALEDVDVGFALLPAYWNSGYASEAAAAALAYGHSAFGLPRIVAITAPDNERSARVLEKLGMGFERMVRLSEDGPESRLYAHDF
jgi:RimJ/RimL family protein N-acetyltransferase